MRLNHALAAIALLTTLAFAAPALADVRVVVDKSQQQMQVFEDGSLLYTWDVSTGKKWSWTHEGTFGVTRMEEMWYSRSYENAPMPWSVFFDGGIAIHGTVAANYPLLGTQQSHGCVRLHQKNAQIFFNLVEEVGRENVTIIVQA